MSSRSARNDLDNFSTHSSGTVSLSNENSSSNGLNDDSQFSLNSHSGNGDNGQHNHSNPKTAPSGGLNNNSKYDKLVQDYVKLRSKLTIVKKAYVELTESSAQKDQMLRKFEQEIEGLTFRNQQLTSRVEVLQRDLVEAASSPSANTVKLSPSSSSLVSPAALSPNNSNSLLTSAPLVNSHNHSSSSVNCVRDDKVIAEELEHKINENTVLHRRLNEVEVEFRQKLAKTESSLKQVEYEKALLEKKLESLELTSKQSIEKLQNEKIKLELNLIQLESQLRETHQEKESLIQQSNSIMLIKNSSSSSLSSIPNNASVVTAGSIKSGDESALSNCIRAGCEALARIYSSLEERNGYLKPFLANGPSLKLAAKCESSLAAIETKLRNGSSMSAGLFDELADINRKLLQATIAELGVSTSVSLAQSSGSAALARPSEDMDKLHKKLKIYLNKIDAFLYEQDDQQMSFTQYLKGLFVCFVTGSTSGGSNPSVYRSKFPSGVKQLVDLIEKLLFAYNEKLSLEYTLDYSTSITTLDECLVSYFGQLKQSLTQLAALAEGSNLIELIEGIRSEIMVEPTTAPSPLATSEEMDALKEQLVRRESELRELSESHEQLKTNYEASVRLGDELKSRLEKLQGQYLELDERRRSDERELNSLRLSASASPSPSENDRVFEPVQSKPVEEAGDQEAMLEFTSTNIDLVETYQKQIDTLNNRLQYLDSKTVYYHDEMRSLIERLRLQQEANRLQELELDEVKDQLDRTRLSYENQMSTMSDHLVEMTDRMGRQSEENERLKHDLAQARVAANTPAKPAAAPSSSKSKNNQNKK